MEIHVIEIPPYKQAWADAQERINQKKRVDALKAIAQEQNHAIIKEDKVRLSITYYRCRGRSDACNIIGGISDSLNGLAYIDDRQIAEVHYNEEKGMLDEYTIIIDKKQ